MAKAKRKSRATWLTIELPSNDLDYEGFGDSEADRHVEYQVGDDATYSPGNMQFEKNHPRDLRLEAYMLSDILNDCTDWPKVIEKAYEYHTEAFDNVASDDLGFALYLEHDICDTARIKLSVAKKLLRLCKRDKYEGFLAIFDEEKGRWSERDGRLLLDQPLTNWESNELGDLLRAALAVGREVPMRLSTLERYARIACGMPVTTYEAARSEREFNEDVFGQIYDGESEYNAWEKAVDWKKYEEQVQKARQDLFDELSEKDQQRLIDHGYWDGTLPWFERCPLTMELNLSHTV